MAVIARAVHGLRSIGSRALQSSSHRMKVIRHRIADAIGQSKGGESVVERRVKQVRGPMRGGSSRGRPAWRSSSAKT